MRNYFKEPAFSICEGNSVVECQLPKLNAAGSTPVPRLKVVCFKKNLHLVFLLTLLYFVSGCATTEEIRPIPRVGVPKEGIYHKVRQGETIWRIAKTYDISVDDIVRS